MLLAAQVDRSGDVCTGHCSRAVVYPETTDPVASDPAGLRQWEATEAALNGYDFQALAQAADSGRWLRTTAATESSR